MTINEIFNVLSDIAPLQLSNEFVAIENGYDNSGILVYTDEDINAALFTLDLTNASVDKALKLGAKLIVTHHPAIYAPIKALENGIIKKD